MTNSILDRFIQWLEQAVSDRDIEYIVDSSYDDFIDKYNWIDGDKKFYDDEVF